MKVVFKVILSLVLFFSVLSPAIETEASGKFKDTRGHWAEKEINYLSGIGIINGFTDGSFKPNVSVTRGQTAIMLVRALGINTANRPNPGFKDLSPKHSAYKYIAALVDEGLYPKGVNYAPDKPLKREEMARMLVRAYSLKGNKNVTFKDVPKSYWAHPYISVLAENGITTGYSNGTFKPKEEVTRGQFSVFLSRALNDSFQKTPVSPAPPVKTTPVLMKDVTFGMTYQQVKNRETRRLIFDSHDLEPGVLIYEVRKYNLDADLTYVFDYNNLSGVWYEFNPFGYYFTGSELYNGYSVIKTEVIREFGQPAISDEYNYADYGSLWIMNGYDVMLYATNMSGESKITLSYHKQGYQGASVRSEESKLNQLKEKMNEYSKDINN